MIISSSSLCLGLYDRSNTKNKPVVRFLQPCGNKFTIKRADKKNTTLKGLAPKIKRKKKKIKVKNELN